MKGINIVLLILVGNLLLSTFSHPMHKEMMDSLANKSNKDKFKYWHYFMKRPYDLNSEESLKRYKIFKKNLAEIEKINSSQNKYSLGLGPFTDLEFDEWVANMNAEKVEETKKRNLISFDELADKDDKQNLGILDIDYEYTDYSYLLNVESYATEVNICPYHNSVRTMAKIIDITAKLLGIAFKPSSAQSIRNCHGSYNDYFKNDCGTIPSVLTLYLQIVEFGIPTEEDIPWNVKRGECAKDTYKPYYRAERWVTCTIYGTNNYCGTQIARGAMKHGPYVSHIQLTDKVMHYNSGIIPNDSCVGPYSWNVIVTTFKSDHAVVFPNFGTKFGNYNGFIKVERTIVGSPEPSCGVEGFVLQPIDVYLAEDK
jgi:hypothetical protein